MKVGAPRWESFITNGWGERSVMTETLKEPEVQWPPWVHHMDQPRRDALALWFYLRHWSRAVNSAEPSLEGARTSEPWQLEARAALHERAQALATAGAARRAKRETAAVVVQRYGRGKLARQRSKKERERRVEAAERERARKQAAAAAAAQAAAEMAGELAAEEAAHRRQLEKAAYMDREALLLLQKQNGRDAAHGAALLGAAKAAAERSRVEREGAHAAEVAARDALAEVEARGDGATRSVAAAAERAAAARAQREAAQTAAEAAERTGASAAARLHGARRAEAAAREEAEGRGREVNFATADAHAAESRRQTLLRQLAEEEAALRGERSKCDAQAAAAARAVPRREGRRAAVRAKHDAAQQRVEEEDLAREEYTKLAGRLYGEARAKEQRLGATVRAAAEARIQDAHAEQEARSRLSAAEGKLQKLAHSAVQLHAYHDAEVAVAQPVLDGLRGELAAAEAATHRSTERQRAARSEAAALRETSDAEHERLQAASLGAGSSATEQTRAEAALRSVQERATEAALEREALARRKTAARTATERAARQASLLSRGWLDTEKRRAASGARLDADEWLAKQLRAHARRAAAETAEALVAERRRLVGAQVAMPSGEQACLRGGGGGGGGSGGGGGGGSALTQLQAQRRLRGAELETAAMAAQLRAMGLTLQQQIVAGAAHEARRAAAASPPLPPPPRPPRPPTEGGAAVEVEYIKWDGTLATAAVQRGATSACFVSMAEGQPAELLAVLLYRRESKRWQAQLVHGPGSLVVVCRCCQPTNGVASLPVLGHRLLLDDWGGMLRDWPGVCGEPEPPGSTRTLQAAHVDRRLELSYLNH